jgi:two-component system response regulator AtoC
MSHALIVDEDVVASKRLSAVVAAERFTVASAHTLRDARRQIALQQPDLLLLDLELPDGNGIELFDDPTLIAQAQVVLTTGQASLDSSIQALRLGAADYLVKPVQRAQLQAILARVMRPADLTPELDQLEAEWARSGRFGQIWGRSPAMQRVIQQIARVAGTDVSVFINGDSGSGKEVVARTVHQLSRRREQAFLAVNCGAISPTLIESEVFGHEKGSFTGAERQHPGFFERADGGTLFLDEIAEMPPELQVKLLRVLESGVYMRVGSTQQLEADVRVIAATNRPLDAAVASGKLREDLLFRLNVFPIALPRLRERREDIELLATHFLDDIARREGRRKHLSAAALAKLAAYPWPGNVRELRNAIERAYVMSDGDVIDGDWLPRVGCAPTQTAIGADAPGQDQHAAAAITVALGTSVADAERRLILATLEHFEHQRERSAAALGISLKTLYNRLKEYGRGGRDRPRRR